MGTEEGQIETPSECKVIPTQKHQKMCVTKGWSQSWWEVKNISNKYEYLQDNKRTKGLVNSSSLRQLYYFFYIINMNTLIKLNAIEIYLL